MLRESSFEGRRYEDGAWTLEDVDTLLTLFGTVSPMGRLLLRVRDRMTFVDQSDLVGIDDDVPF